MSDNGKKRSGGGRGGGGGGPRKKKGHFMQSNSGRPSDKAIPLGATGLLVTCDSGREYKAFDEMMRLLEECFQRLGKDHVGRTAGKQQQQQQPAAAAAADTAAAEDAAGGGQAAAGDTAAAAADDGGDGGGSSKAGSKSIADMLAAEVADLKAERVHRFKRHNTDVRGTVFIEFPKSEDCPTPEAVAEDIAQHVKATRSLPARYVLRLLPVALTCFASPEELRGLTGAMVDKYFGTDGDNKATAPTDFAVEYEHRASDKLKRPDVIDIVAKAVPQPPYKVNLTNPDRTILVQAVRNAAAISVVSSFRGFAKYNLRRLVELEEGGEGGEKKEEGKAAAAAAAGGEEKAGDQAAAAADAAADADKPAEAAAAEPAAVADA